MKAQTGQTAFPVRPRIGVLFFTSGWFREVGLQDPGSDTTAQVEATARRAASDLESYFEPVFTKVLFDAAEARAEARRLAKADLDGLLVSPLMWCEDQVVRAALAELPGLPLVLWTFSPEAALPQFLPFQRMIRGSGAVCTLQLSGMLHRERRWLRSVAGPLGDPQVYRAIGAWARALAVARRLASLRVGVLPFRCDQMSTTWVDEFELRRLYGVELAYLELERVRRAAGEAAASEVAAFKQGLEAAGTRVAVDARNLEEGIRYALALERVLREEKLPALAMNDVIPEMHASFGLRPCLSNPRLSGEAVVSMEADVAAAVAMQALRLATGERPFYTETFGADYAAGALLLGHAGYHDAANAGPGPPGPDRAGRRVRELRPLLGRREPVQVPAGAGDPGQLGMGRGAAEVGRRAGPFAGGAAPDGRQLPPALLARGPGGRVFPPRRGERGEPALDRGSRLPPGRGRAPLRGGRNPPPGPALSAP